MNFDFFYRCFYGSVQDLPIAIKQLFKNFRDLLSYIYISREDIAVKFRDFASCKMLFSSVLIACQAKYKRLEKFED